MVSVQIVQLLIVQFSVRLLFHLFLDTYILVIPLFPDILNEICV
jgi:hypothetical protein